MRCRRFDLEVDNCSDKGFRFKRNEQFSAVGIDVMILMARMVREVLTDVVYVLKRIRPSREL